jgi:hypothetical protein
MCVGLEITLIHLSFGTSQSEHDLSHKFLYGYNEQTSHRQIKVQGKPSKTAT